MEEYIAKRILNEVLQDAQLSRLLADEELCEMALCIYQGNADAFSSKYNSTYMILQALEAAGVDFAQYGNDIINGKNMVILGFYDENRNDILHDEYFEDCIDLLYTPEMFRQSAYSTKGPGIPYFSNERDVKKACEILSKKLGRPITSDVAADHDDCYLIKFCDADLDGKKVPGYLLVFKN